MSYEVQMKQNLPVVKDENCEKIWNIVVGQRITEKYDRFEHFCVKRNERPCRGSGTIMAVQRNENDDHEPYWYAVGFYGEFGQCYGYQVCEKIVTQMKWITQTLRPYDDSTTVKSIPWKIVLPFL